MVAGETVCIGAPNAPGCIEKIPTRQRDMNMRLIVRDNAGGIAYDETVITVTQDAGPFELLVPNGGEALTSSKVISWDVASTNVAPVSTAEVEFSLSIDGERPSRSISAQQITTDTPPSLSRKVLQPHKQG